MIEFVIVILSLTLIIQSIIGYYIIKLLISRPGFDRSGFLPNDRSNAQSVVNKDEFSQKVEVPEALPNLKKPPRPTGGFGSNVS